MSAKVKQGPFAPEIVEKASGLVAGYHYVVNWDPEENGYAAQGVEYDTNWGFGATIEEAIAECRGNVLACVCYDLERGETPPAAKVGALKLASAG